MGAWCSGPRLRGRDGISRVWRDHFGEGLIFGAQGNQKGAERIPRKVGQTYDKRQKRRLSAEGPNGLHRNLTVPKRKELARGGAMGQKHSEP